MVASQKHVYDSTPMGGRLVADGATFRVWAPQAEHVYVALGGAKNYIPRAQDELVKNQMSGHWTGFFPDISDGTKYRFHVAGQGGKGFKRDPRARELEFLEHSPHCNCVLRPLNSYPWHDQDYRPPAINDLIVYQFHIGVFSARDVAGQDIRPYRVAKFLDALDRVEYLADLGITALQPLPLVKFQGEWNPGYRATDIFSPEMDYCVDPAEIGPYLAQINVLLANKGFPPVGRDDVASQVDQLKAFIDVCHLYGLAVIPDVVYNHVGGEFDSQSVDHFDFPASPNDQNNLYFSNADHSTGEVFAFERPEVRQFLIDNAAMFLQEYHVDGLRFDEVSVIENNGGHSLCQDMTQTLHYIKPTAVLIAEYWNTPREQAVLQPPEGLGFDLGYADGVRDVVRGMLTEARRGADASIDLLPLHQILAHQQQDESAARSYNCLENHDLVLDADGDHHRWPRIPALADATDSRSWVARSRSRVATGLLLTAPGVPMLFMGQEFLEDRLWSDYPTRADRFINWDSLTADRRRTDFHRFTRDLIWLRRSQPALQRGSTDSFHLDTPNRVLAFHRWVPEERRDVVIVMSLSDTTLYSYSLGFPAPGPWYELFNSDYYDHFPNSWVQGNNGKATAYALPMHGLPCSATVTIPANTILIFSQTKSRDSRTLVSNESAAAASARPVWSRMRTSNEYYKTFQR